MILDEVYRTSDGAQLGIAVVGVWRRSDGCCGVGSVGNFNGSVDVLLIINWGYALFWAAWEIVLFVSYHFSFILFF